MPYHLAFLSSFRLMDAGTHEEMQESECTGAPAPAAEGFHENDGCSGDVSNDEDNSVNITDDDSPSSQRPAHPASPSSGGSLMP
jgi:hypothetical protein